MKKITFLVLLAVTFIACNSISEEKKAEASEYFNSFAGICSPITDGTNAIIEEANRLLQYTIEHGPDSSEVFIFENIQSHLSMMIDLKMEQLDSINEFDEEFKVKLACQDYLGGCKSVIENDFSELNKLLLLDVTPENAVKVGEVTLNLWSSLINAEKSSKTVLDGFAKKYSIAYSELNDLAKEEEQLKMVKEQFKQQTNQL